MLMCCVLGHSDPVENALLDNVRVGIQNDQVQRLSALGRARREVAPHGLAFLGTPSCLGGRGLCGKPGGGSHSFWGWMRGHCNDRVGVHRGVW